MTPQLLSTRLDDQWRRPHVEVRCGACTASRPRLLALLARLSRALPDGTDFLASGGWCPEVHSSVRTEPDCPGPLYHPTIDEWCVHLVTRTKIGQQTRRIARERGLRPPKAHSYTVLTLPLSVVECAACGAERGIDRDDLARQIRPGSLTLLA